MPAACFIDSLLSAGRHLGVRVSAAGGAAPTVALCHSSIPSPLQLPTDPASAAPVEVLVTVTLPTGDVALCSPGTAASVHAAGALSLVRDPRVPLVPATVAPAAVVAATGAASAAAQAWRLTHPVASLALDERAGDGHVLRPAGLDCVFQLAAAAATTSGNRQLLVPVGLGALAAPHEQQLASGKEGGSGTAHLPPLLISSRFYLSLRVAVLVWPYSPKL